MLRKLILVVCAMSLTLASCGRQVTPDRANTQGVIQINFITQGPLDFTNNVYVLAVNQEGQEPAPFYASQLYNFQNLDFEVLVSSTGGAQPSVQIYPFVSQVVSGKNVRIQGPRIGYSPQDVVLVTNCNQQGTEFCLTINRALLVQPASPSPAPTASASPCPSTSPSASPSGSASPSASPSPSPSASPSSSPSSSPTPCTSPSSLWAINWWTVSPVTGQIVDAPGLQGPQDKGTFSFLVDTTTSGSCFSGTSISNCTWTAQAGWPAAPSASAQIQGGQVINNP